MPAEMLIVPMDGILIEQVLMNLMENSVQHGKTVKKIRIRVTLGNGRVTTAVEDDGCGIPKSVLPSIFEGKISVRSGRAVIPGGIWESVCRSA